MSAMVVCFKRSSSAAQQSWDHNCAAIKEGCQVGTRKVIRRVV